MIRWKTETDEGTTENMRDLFFSIPEIQIIVLESKEITHIRNHFDNVPLRINKGQQFYFGEMAKFLIANW